MPRATLERPRGWHALAARLAASPWLTAASRRAGGLPTLDEVRQRIREAEADAGTHAASVALLELAGLRTVAPYSSSAPVSDTLRARLLDEAVTRLEAALRADPGWPTEVAGPECSRALLQKMIDVGDAAAIHASGLRNQDVYVLARL